jgi:diguanylate cyclase (GGDEF)-like protein
VVILFFFSFGIRKIFVKHNINDAEQDATGISQAIFIQERDVFLGSDSEKEITLNVAPEDLLRLDEHMKNYLHPLNIVKIKVYSTDRKIIYSTDHSIIGQIDAHNEKLKRALKGEVVSNLEKKDNVWDLAGEKRYDIDLVETYLPVRDKNNEIKGSFEVYIDISRYQNEIEGFLKSFMIIGTVILVLVFGFLFVQMRQGTNQLSKIQKELEKLSATDVLTGIFNRRHLFIRAEEEFAKTHRQTKNDDAVGYIMIDVDNFKKINDTYGHIIGDEILKELANRLISSIRKYDIAGRYGGEEFLVILPNSNFEATQKVAERIWTTCKEQPFIVKKSSHNITVSLGIACIKKEDKELDAVLKRADEGLYKAKNLGRDRIAWV